MDTQYLIRGLSVILSVRADGQLLPIYLHNGEFWLEASWGAKFAIVVQNTTNRRIEVVESVDGRDVLVDRPANFMNGGMIVPASESWHNLGWRLDDDHVNRFVFTDPAQAIASQATGSTRNIGVIGIAVYRERVPPPINYARPKGEWRGGPEVFGSDLGTGMGETVHDPVGHDHFDRATGRPLEVIQLQYRSRAWLVEKGIIRPGHGTLPSAFPDDDTGYEKYRKTR